MLWETNQSRSLLHERLSPVNFGDYRSLNQVFEDAAAWRYPQVNLTAPDHEPLRVRAVCRRDFRLYPACAPGGRRQRCRRSACRVAAAVS